MELSTRFRLLTGLDAEPRLELVAQVPAARVRTPAPPTAASDESLYDDRVDAATRAVAIARSRVRELTGSNGITALLSGYLGFGAAESSFGDLSSSGSFGVYGLRVHLSYPLFRGGESVALTEARAELRRAEARRHEAVVDARARYVEYRLREDSAARRMDLLRRSVEAARARRETVERLIREGLRSQGDLAQADADLLRRELALIAAQVERWKMAERIARMTGVAREGGS